MKASWWTLSEPHNEVASLARATKEGEHGRYSDWLGLFGLYDQSIYTRFRGSRFSPEINTYREIIDTAVNYFGKNIPRPKFLTSNASETLRARARNLTQYVRGCMYLDNLASKAQYALLHGAICGTGFLRVHDYGSRPTYDWIFPLEVGVHESEAFYGEPSSLYIIRLYPKSQLQAMFPKAKGYIQTATATEVAGASDMVEVFEAYHLPSGEEAKDGRHVVCIENATLWDEKWEDSTFPVCRFVFTPEASGWFGSGLGKVLKPYQIKIVEAQKAVDNLVKLTRSVKILVDMDSGLSPRQLRQTLTSSEMLPFRGKPPSYLAAPAIDQQLILYRDRVIADAWNAARFSKAMMDGLRPNISGTALLTWQDQVQSNHILTGQNWERLWLDLASETVKASRRIEKRTGKAPESTVLDTGVLSLATFEDISEDDYRIECLPVSRIPESMSGRIEVTKAFTEMGIWGRDEMLEAFDSPDVSGELAWSLAERRNIDKKLETMIEEDRFIPPHAKLNLQLALRRGTQFYNKCEYDGVAPDKLQHIDQWIAHCLLLIQQATPPQPEQPATPDTMPMPA